MAIYGKRVYWIGGNACHNCTVSKHHDCRPKLDGTLCSCQCEQAELVRQLALMYQRDKNISKIGQAELKEILRSIGKRLVLHKN